METLRARLNRKPIVVVPGVYDAFTALVATQAGFATLYVSGPAMRVVQSLPLNHRSSVLRVIAYHRTAVASWYLRIRDCAGRDPMWGLLRVETAMPDRSASPQQVADHANLVSRWILAEMMPLSLPDSRWDKMVYGIHDCEEFLKALRT